jgi:ketosteroid isomerase-like protein
MYQRIALSLATLCLTSLVPTNLAVLAAVPTPIPRELAQTVSALDQAANQRQLEAVLSFYSDTFSHQDGLTKTQLSQNLKELWQKYSQLQYSTRIVKLDVNGDNYTAETVTEINGKDNNKDKPSQLQAKIISRQVYQRSGNQFRMVRQEVISERSSISSGAKPPVVRLKVPEVIGVGRQFTLDAIVDEPLGFSMLLGGVVDEPVNPKNYLQANPVRLQSLRAGGIFRVGKAPFNEGDRWISVVLVREDGMTIATQRVRVSRDQVGNQYTPLPNLPFSPSRIRPNPTEPPSS